MGAQPSDIIQDPTLRLLDFSLHCCIGRTGCRHVGLQQRGTPAAAKAGGWCWCCCCWLCRLRWLGLFCWLSINRLCCRLRRLPRRLSCHRRHACRHMEPLINPGKFFVVKRAVPVLQQMHCSIPARQHWSGMHVKGGTAGLCRTWLGRQRLGAGLGGRAKRQRRRRQGRSLGCCALRRRLHVDMRKVVMRGVS